MSEIVHIENYPSKAKCITVRLQRTEAFDLVEVLKAAHKADRYAFNIFGRPSDLVEQLEKVLNLNKTASDYRLPPRMFDTANV